MANRSVLFVGGGRRVGLAQYWRQRGYVVWAYEGTKDVPIALVADLVVIGKPWDEAQQNLETTLHDLRPSLTLFLMDQATAVGANIRTRPGVVVSPPEAAQTCLDKQAFERHVLSTFPDLYPKAVYDEYPRVVKPRFGYGSRGVAYVHDKHELTRELTTRAAAGETDPVVQLCVRGTEYTVDAYFDRAGFMIDCVPRVRERVAGGEVISSRVESNNGLHALTRLVGESIGIVGPACIQFVRTSSGRYYVLEANARFGGGSVLSLQAGFDMIGLIEQDYLSVPCGYVPGSWDTRLAMHRYYGDFFYAA